MAENKKKYTFKVDYPVGTVKGAPKRVYSKGKQYALDKNTADYLKSINIIS